jgi:uncharacterized membrane protein YjfL (UPF0719 family)
MDVLLGLGILLTIVLWGRWYNSLRLGRSLRSFHPGLVVFALVPVFCLIFLLAALLGWSANNAKSDLQTVALYLLLGACWLGLTQLVFGLLGVSARDDVIERRNPAAAWVISGQLIGATCCFAGATVGNGPGPEVVVFCVFLSTATLFLLWFLVDRAAFIADTITIDRHPGTGIRACGWFVATGVVLGDAATGNWISTSGNVREFAACAWPAAAFAPLMIVLERKMRTLAPDDRWNGARRSIVLAVVFVICAAGYALKRGIR